MKEQIQQLVANGRTEEALQLLAQSNGDAILLQARYNNGKKQYNMGLIDFSEWQRIQAQVNYALLELAGNGDPVPVSGAQTTTGVRSADRSMGATVFISYNHGDATYARKVRDFLQNNQIDVIIDEDDMPAGMSIMEFIQESIKKCDAVVSIVSGKSLSSGWVGQESIASMYAIWLADKKFIPVRLDNVVFDIDFQIAAQESILKKIEDLDTKINKLKSLGGDPSPAEDDRNRLNQLKNNLGQIIQRLKSVLILDVTDQNFDANMQKVLNSILAA